MKSINSATTFWWLILAAGILLLGLGVWVIISPFESYLSISLVLAVCVFTTGILEIIFAIVNFKSIESWGWILLSGLIDFSIGGYLFLYPLITMAILPLIVGFWLLFRGFSAISGAITLRSYCLKDWGWLLGAGIVLILLSLVILTNPVFGIINLVFWTGVSLIWAGIFRILVALRLQKLGRGTARSIPID